MVKCKCWYIKYEWSYFCADYLKQNKINIPISFIGSHVQALPKKPLLKKNIDFVFTNKGFTH